MVSGVGKSGPMHRLGGPVPLAWLDRGVGEPALMIHGFASTAEVNWVAPGWTETLAAAGRRALAFDNRGHGGSGKPHDPDEYALNALAADALRVLDAAGVVTADVIGYSLGARIAATLANASPHRVRSLVLAGIGETLLTGRMGAEEIAAALEASTADGLSGRGKMFRDFADRNGSDRVALAACMRGTTGPIAAAALAQLGMPVLVAVGEKDEIAGAVEPLLAALPSADYLPIPHRDHMKAVGDRVFKAGVLDFLARRP